jgi:ATP-dependent phosphofructokinase / diphosphate-dependent phosphofructokinase
MCFGDRQRSGRRHGVQVAPCYSQGVPALNRLGVLTGGGDAPGLNAVIRAVVKSAGILGIEVIGLEDSFDGLIQPDRWRRLTAKDVTGILRRGGTILGTTNHGNPFAYPVSTPEGRRDYSAVVVENFRKLQLDALVVIGGDGTLAIAQQFALRGIPIVGVPKTIDNDIVGTTTCFGFDSAVDFATEAIDRLHATAEAHHRILVAEVMGRYAGWIALYAGVAGGADAILIPEIPFDLEIVAKRLKARERWGARFSVVVVAEGAYPRGGTLSLIEPGTLATPERLGGVGAHVCAGLQHLTGKETRAVVLGHLQRGGEPTSSDRVLATRFGHKAVELARAGSFGLMVAYDPPDIVTRPLQDIVGRTKTISLESDLVATARAIGITLGD